MNKLKVGDREWRQIEGFEYKISNDGEVMSLITGKILKGGLNPCGYRTVSLIRWIDGMREQVGANHHILVARYFIGPRPNGLVINHKNGIKTDNNIDNLEYCTPRDNREHAKAMRLYKSGSRCSWSKLSEEQVLCIRRGKDAGLSNEQLARAFKVTKKAITQLLKGKSWKYADEVLSKKCG